MSAYDSFTFERNGRTYRAELHYDPDHGAPWEEEDGHGPVTDWTRRDKRPGEMVLIRDHGMSRFYDFAEASRIAKRDGWGLCPDEIATLAARLGRTPRAGDIRHESVMCDFDRLRRWCNDEWHYCGVVVTCEDDGDDDSASLWGIESDCEDYIREVAEDLAAEIESRIAANDATIARAIAEVAKAAAGVSP